jgi:integrase
MAIKKRGKVWYIHFYPFRGLKQKIWISTGTDRKTVAEHMERQIVTACRAQDYSFLDVEARSACLQMFHNQGWEVPSDLSPLPVVPHEELTLWKGIELCLKDPEIRNSKNRERHQQAFVHVVEHWGKDFPVKAIRIPEIKTYQADRLKQGAAASTINKERAALSRMFEVLKETDLVARNPIRDVRPADERDGEREVYISFADFSALVCELPEWLKPIVQTIYFTGMRRGEALGLMWRHVDLDRRIITLEANETKEGKRKKVPIHRVIASILEHLKGTKDFLGHVFTVDDGNPPCPDSLKKPWKKALAAAGLPIAITIHNLRHAWSTNAMKSGMHPQISETIMGHALRKKDVQGRYLMIGDEDLIRAIDRMRFDWDRTQVWFARSLQKKENPAERTAGFDDQDGSKIVARSSLLPNRLRAVRC